MLLFKETSQNYGTLWGMVWLFGLTVSCVKLCISGFDISLKVEEFVDIFCKGVECLGFRIKKVPHKVELKLETSGV
jgi:hypothetical protein